MWLPPNPEIRFSQECFHQPVRKDKRFTHKVHLQHVDTFRAVQCGVRMCLEPCFLRYYTLKDFYFNNGDHEGSQSLKEGRGRPRTRGRGIAL